MVCTLHLEMAFGDDIIMSISNQVWIRNVKTAEKLLKRLLKKSSYVTLPTLPLFVACYIRLICTARANINHCKLARRGLSDATTV